MKDLLERCEIEMRYAGWSVLEVDNPQRQDLYARVQAALAQPAQEPKSVTYKEVVDAMNALMSGDTTQVQIALAMGGKKLYTTPQQRPWIGLTEARIKEIWLKGKDNGDDWLDVLALARSFEAELKEKNT